MSVLPVTSIPGVTSGAPSSIGKAADSNFGQNNFAKLLSNANEQQLTADKAVNELADGSNTSLHNVVLSAAKADLSFRLVLEIRNKLIESFQEIMRMQV
jgi:flagellar hook-basal body complex protein FliE